MLELGRTLARNAQGTSVLGARGHRQLDAPVDCRNLDLSAQCRFGDRDRHVDGQVVAIAHKYPARSHPCDDDQVTGLAAAYTTLALARLTDAGPVFDPGRNLDRIPLVGRHRSGARTGRTGVIDDGPVAVAPCACLTERKATQVAPGHPTPAAVRTQPRTGAGAGTRSRACTAGLVDVDGDHDLGTLHGLLERQCDLHLDIGSARRCLLWLTAALTAPTKHVAKDVCKVAKATRGGSARSPAGRHPPAEGTRGVVLTPLGLVR